MKNLALGLLLTVGISGFAAANGIYDYQLEEELISCTIAVHVTITHCDGSKSVDRRGSYETDCGNNEDGTLIIRNIQLKAACDGDATETF